MTYSINSNTGAHIFSSGANERMRIDSAGNVGIGTTSPGALVNLASNSESEGAVLRLENTRTAMFGGDVYGKIQFFGNDNSTSASGIRAFINGNSTGPNGEAALVFGTANLNTVVAERMRINSDGNLLVGLTSATGVALLQVSGPIRTTGYTVATLPAGTVGMRTYVTDALAPSFGVAVAGSGAVTIPVFYDGANWIVA
jgi:hypothetical protein